MAARNEVDLVSGEEPVENERAGDQEEARKEKGMKKKVRKERGEEEEEEEDGGKDMKGARVVLNLSHHPDHIAVRIIRAFRSVKIRQNKWRPVPHNLTGDNIEIDACIASGSFGIVFRAENRDTRTKGEPGRKYAIKVTDFRLLTESREFELATDLGPDHSPTLTQSSEAHIIEPEEMRRRSLYAKRTNEMKTSLRYIKEGHQNVCNMEGFAEFNILGCHYFMYILELCDLGTLYDMVSAFRKNEEYIPEGFMASLIPFSIIHSIDMANFKSQWHAFEQLLDGLTFLHGEHPDYKDNERSRGEKSSVILRDIKPNNVFLQASHEKEAYPIVKLADFGEAVHLPIGGTRNFYFGNSVCDPPDDKMSAKYDVWSIGVEIYYMALDGHYPNEGCDMDKLDWPLHGDASPETRKMMQAARSNPKRFPPIDDHLTSDLCHTLRWVMNLDRHERPSALQAWRRIKGKNEERKKLMYRALPDWVEMRTKRDFATLELVQLEFKMQLAEDEGFIFEYAGNMPHVRRKAERKLLLEGLENEKRDARAMKEGKLREFKQRAGEGRRAWALERYKREAEWEQIEKIEQERKRFGGWLEPTMKRRRMGLGKLGLQHAWG